MTTRTHHRTGAGARLNADHIGLYRLIVGGVIVTLLAAVLTSWNGLVFVAGWQHLPEFMRWLTPVMIDVPLIVLTLVRLALKSRGERSGGLFWLALGLTAFSSMANFLHTSELAGLESVGAWVGSITNALAPFLILMMTEVLGMVVTRPSPSVRRERAAPVPSRAAVFEPLAVNV